MNHITRWKRNTRLMWTVWAIVMVALLAIISNLAGLPEMEPEECFTDTCVQCVLDCLDPAPSNNLSIIKGE